MNWHSQIRERKDITMSNTMNTTNNTTAIRTLAHRLGMKENNFRGRTSFSGKVRGKHAFLSQNYSGSWVLRLSPDANSDLIEEVEAYLIPDEETAKRLAVEFG